MSQCYNKTFNNWYLNTSSGATYVNRQYKTTHMYTFFILRKEWLMLSWDWLHVQYYLYVILKTLHFMWVGGGGWNRLMSMERIIWNRSVLKQIKTHNTKHHCIFSLGIVWLSCHYEKQFHSIFSTNHAVCVSSGFEFPPRSRAALFRLHHICWTWYEYFLVHY